MHLRRDRRLEDLAVSPPQLLAQALELLGISGLADPKRIVDTRIPARYCSSSVSWCRFSMSATASVHFLWAVLNCSSHAAAGVALAEVDAPVNGGPAPSFLLPSSRSPSRCPRHRSSNT